MTAVDFPYLTTENARDVVAAARQAAEAQGLLPYGRPGALVGAVRPVVVNWLAPYPAGTRIMPLLALFGALYMFSGRDTEYKVGGAQAEKALVTMCSQLITSILKDEARRSGR